MVILPPLFRDDQVPRDDDEYGCDPREGPDWQGSGELVLQLMFQIFPHGIW